MKILHISCISSPHNRVNFGPIPDAEPVLRVLFIEIVRIRRHDIFRTP